MQMFDTRDFCRHIIQPTLAHLNMYSVAAEKLLLGTAALHSSFNPLLANGDGGLGLYQITPEQHRNVWDSFLAFRPELASKVRGLASQHCFLQSPDQELISNLAYGTAIAWVIFLMAGLPLPDATDEQALLHCWRGAYGQEQNALLNCEPFTECLKGHIAA